MDGEDGLPGVDLEQANAARMYDYFLGGAHNFAVDRELGDRVISAMPTIPGIARGNRAFLARAVRFCVGQGIRQFLDLGSGIPTADHVHDIARAIAPETRVAYVDFEPVAVAHSQELLADVPGTSVTRADIRDPAAVLAAPTVTDLLDFTAPIGVLAVAVVHFIANADDPDAMLASYLRAVVPGSYLVLTQVSTDYDDPAFVEQVTRATEVYRSSATPGHPRSRDRIRELVGHRPLVEPGLVDIARWRNDDTAAPDLGSYAAVAEQTEPGEQRRGQ